jgi:hypothetical protein
MRPAFALSLAALVCLSAVLAVPAGAKTVIPPAPKLRGLQTATPAKPAAGAPSATGAAPLALWTQPDTDATQCRQACAQARYFCDANANSDDCAPNWGQCVAACASPNLTVNPLGGGGN